MIDFHKSSVSDGAPDDATTCTRGATTSSCSPSEFNSNPVHGSIPPASVNCGAALTGAPPFSSNPADLEYDAAVRALEAAWFAERKNSLTLRSIAASSTDIPVSSSVSV